MSSQEQRDSAAVLSLATELVAAMQGAILPITTAAVAGGESNRIILSALNTAFANAVCSTACAIAPHGRERELAQNMIANFLWFMSQTDWCDYRARYDAANRVSRPGAGEQVRPC